MPGLGRPPRYSGFKLRNLEDFMDWVEFKVGWMRERGLLRDWAAGKCAAVKPGSGGRRC